MDAFAFKDTLHQNWEKFLAYLAALLLVLAAAAWLLNWGGEAKDKVTGTRIQTPKSLLNPELAFAFRGDSGEFAVSEPHPFFFVLPEKNTPTNRPWTPLRPPVNPPNPGNPDKPPENPNPDPPDNGDPPPQDDPKPPQVKCTYLGWMTTPSGEQRALIRYPKTGVEQFFSRNQKIRGALAIKDFSPQGLVLALPDGSTVTLAKGETKTLPLE